VPPGRVRSDAAGDACGHDYKQGNDGEISGHYYRSGEMKLKEI